MGARDVVLWACAALSGAAALGLEMLWMRSASLVAGGTPATTAAVLATCFAGLAAGSLAAARPLQRPVRAYGFLELGAALGTGWSVLVFHVLGKDAAQSWLAAWGMPAVLAAIALAILPASACLGATLPVLGDALAGHGRLESRGGLLYGLNTGAGAGGIAAAGFGLPAAIGVVASYAAAGLASATAGASALLVAATPGARHRPPPAGAQRLVSSPRPELRLVAAASGAIALGLEVLWTRLFAQVLHNSIYSFSALALAYLIAIAGGAAAVPLLLRRAPAARVAAGALVVAAVATLGGFWTFVWWTDGLTYFGMESGLGEYVVRIVFLAALCAGPGAVASGVVLPALWAAWGERGCAARPIGTLTAANCVGAIGGALAAGFLVIPYLGLRGGFLLAALGYVVLAETTAGDRGTRALSYALVLLMAIVDPLRAPIVRLRESRESLRSVRESSAGVVSVVDRGGDLQLRLDNYYVLGGSAAAVNERREGLLPLLLHPAPRKVAFIGLATGITASAAPALGVGETTIAEVVPAVAEAAGEQFSPWNGGLLTRPNVHLRLQDGRRILQATPNTYDAIVSDLFVPWRAGAGSLYTREMYATVARRLAPGGLFCQWLPLYQLTHEEFDVIVHTFLSVFPRVSLWRDDFYPNRPVVALVGGSAAAAVDLEDVRRRVTGLPDWARDPLLTSPYGLVMLYGGDLSAARDWFAAAPLNSDDRPRIEFLAPRLTRVGPRGDKDWFVAQELADFYDRLAAVTSARALPFRPVTPEVDAAWRAGRLLYAYALAAHRGERERAASLEAEVRGLVPEVVAAAGLPAMSAPDLATVRQALGELRGAQERLRRQIETIEGQLAGREAPGGAR